MCFRCNDSVDHSKVAELAVKNHILTNLRLGVYAKHQIKESLELAGIPTFAQERLYNEILEAAAKEGLT